MESITTNKTNNNKELTSMETKEYYRINNWQELQKGQLPNERTPFIKVHTNLLISKPWFDLDDTSRLIFIELQLLGSECMGYLPDDETIAFRIRFVVDGCVFFQHFKNKKRITQRSICVL